MAPGAAPAQEAPLQEPEVLSLDAPGDTAVAMAANLSEIAAVGAPPPPSLPETIRRAGPGRSTVRAVALDGELSLDGVLDEAIYERIQPMSEFTQVDPRYGEPAEEQTEVWLFFDDDNLYIAARCWESRPDRIMANELRRDHNNIIQNDNIAFAFDTFFDRRSGVVFETTPIGARLDVQYAYQGQNNYDWNPVWDVRVKPFDRGWTVEARVPFKSLRYRPGSEQTWGFNVRRSSRWRNEVSYLNVVPIGIGMGGIFYSELFAPLVGIEAPSGSRMLEIKPYVVSGLTSDRTVSPQVSNELGGDFGLDVKYGLTQNLTADLTYNTDFAQVEADSQQVNLTRFSLFFPEKREFFLENQGLFNFGGAGGFGGGSAPRLFYSRRIGLSAGRQVPIQGGGRLTGRVGAFNVGLISIRTGEDDAAQVAPTTFSVVRLRRDVLRKSTIGLMATDRSVALGGRGRSQSYGVDARLAFYENVVINGYWAGTNTPGVSGDTTSYRGEFDYGGDRYGLQLDHMVIGRNFRPEVGFVRRVDMARSYAQARFSPRHGSSDLVRKYSMSGSAELIHNGDDRLESRSVQGRFSVEFESSDEFRAGYSQDYEFLPGAFEIAPGVVLPVGGYDFESASIQYQFGRQRAASGTVEFNTGTFYDGTKHELGFNGVRLNLHAQFSVEPTTSINWVDLDQGAFTTTLVGARITYAMSPMSFASALLQYNSSNRSLSANVRLRWEYTPGSELFVVFNEDRDTGTLRFPEIRNRAFVVKINRLFRL